MEIVKNYCYAASYIRSQSPQTLQDPYDNKKWQTLRANSLDGSFALRVPGGKHLSVPSFEVCRYGNLFAYNGIPHTLVVHCPSPTFHTKVGNHAGVYGRPKLIEDMRSFLQLKFLIISSGTHNENFWLVEIEALNQKCKFWFWISYISNERRNEDAQIF